MGESAVVKKYEKIAAELKEAIAERSLKPNDPLPSERDLMQRFAVSRMTIRAAIAKLIDEGAIYSVQGSGTFVGFGDVVAKAPKLTSFSEDMLSRGFTVQSKVLEISRVTPTDDTRQWLKSDDEFFTKLRRLRLADDNPMALETVFLPQSIMPVEGFQSASSLYAQLDERGWHVQRAQQEVTAVNLSSDESKLLATHEHAAAIRIRRVSFNVLGTPVEFATTLYRGDRYSFDMSVSSES